jgi:hypothetical protein
VWAIAAGGCAGGIPQAELNRCRLGVADGNEAFTPRQGAACRMIAQRLASDDKPSDAMGYARKACDLEDARGCEQYLALARAQPSLPPDELLHARASGEKACAGMVVGVDGTDARPALCARTAELYSDVEPRSADDAGRLYARACKLGDAKSCAHAGTLGVAEGRPAVIAPKASPLPLPQPLPRPIATSMAASAPQASSQAAAQAAATPCHEMRPCVSLDVNQRNTNEVVGTIVNRCDRTVACTWCPANGDQADRSGCRSATLAPNESRTGREQGLWYEGFRAIAYDCMDAVDPKGCLAL